MAAVGCLACSVPALCGARSSPTLVVVACCHFDSLVYAMLVFLVSFGRVRQLSSGRCFRVTSSLHTLLSHSLRSTSLLKNTFTRRLTCLRFRNTFTIFGGGEIFAWTGSRRLVMTELVSVCSFIYDVRTDRFVCRNGVELRLMGVGVLKSSSSSGHFRRWDSEVIVVVG